ncbi:unnamed protein product [Prorocentrum cordatum]|uniref:EF-hand domain-containing protein n=1 Tax=Prorocentrum cordatum TaxID=2364126 RepID=A0ABN9WF49_9DINO|nr:unnamed protein product [Polarella glacialis]
MAALPACVVQGDFLDGVVESTVRTMVNHLKAEYQRELCRALEAASLETASGAGAGGIDATQGTFRPFTLNAPVAEISEGQLDSFGELRTTADVPGPPVRASRSTIKRVRMSRPFVEPGAAWRQSCTSNSIKRTGTQLSTAWEAEDLFDRRETMQRNDNCQGRLAQADTEAIKSIREEEIAREEALLARLEKSKTSMLSMPAAGEASPCKLFAYMVLTSWRFDFGMGFVIILNALTIGAETSISRRGDNIPTYLQIADFTFVVLYCIELAMWLYVLGKQKALSNNWLKLDAAMVAAGLLNIFLTLSRFGGDSAAAVVDKANMLKVIRLFRLAKTVRVIVQFRTLWMLVQGLMYAVMPMFWTAILMLVVCYMFAVMAMELIVVSGDNEDYDIPARNFDTIGESMITLIQFITLDSVAGIYRPLVATKPWLFIYFLIFLLLGPIALMNIVTAIMVESSLRTASEDQEAKKAWDNIRRKNMMPKLRSLFLALDISGDGEVDLSEIFNAPSEIQEAMKHIVGLDELEEVFRLLDYDGSGLIDIEEFVEGIMRSQSDKPSELAVLVKQGRAILNRLKGISDQVGSDGNPRRSSTRNRECEFGRGCDDVSPLGD